MKPGAEPSKPTLIIGYGNTLRGDDGLGRVVADHLARLGLPGVTVLSVHQLTIDLAVQLTEFERVILIDALADVEPGIIETVDVQPVNSTPGMSHYVSPGELLLATQTLYEHSPSMVLVGVGAETFDNDGLSAVVESSLDEVVDKVLGIINLM